jgi:hypothetical protein
LLLSGLLAASGLYVLLATAEASWQGLPSQGNDDEKGNKLMEFLTGTSTDIWEPLDVAGNLVRADLTSFGTGRAPGLHLGAVIHAAKVAAGENVGEVEGDQPSVRVQEGFLFETVVEYLLAGVGFDEAVNLAFKRYMLHLRTGIVTQLALQRDAIHGTPDGLNASVPELESYKSTRRSLRNARTAADFEANFWTWVMQEKGYCTMAGVAQVRWFVWWQAGDYSKGKGTGPQVLTAVARFDAEELASNWAGVLAIGARLRAKEAA